VSRSIPSADLDLTQPSSAPVTDSEISHYHIMTSQGSHQFKEVGQIILMINAGKRMVRAHQSDPKPPDINRERLASAKDRISTPATSW
jgi:hypothetical protein